MISPEQKLINLFQTDTVYLISCSSIDVINETAQAKIPHIYHNPMLMIPDCNFDNWFELIEQKNLKHQIKPAGNMKMKLLSQLLNDNKEKVKINKQYKFIVIDL